jgi:two-component system response regulator AtoC
MKTKVLVVDDKAEIREWVKLVLGQDTYDVIEAQDVAGLRRSLAGPAPALVILDLKLPDGNSLAVLPELKQKWPASKVIILTGYGTVEAAEEAYKVDPELFLQSKPFDPETLRALVELALSAKPDRKPSAPPSMDETRPSS